MDCWDSRALVAATILLAMLSPYFSSLDEVGKLDLWTTGTVTYSELGLLW